MRKIIVLAFISLDGVVQAPGGPDEDTSGGFKYGGWTAPLGDEEFGAALQEDLQPADLLLGRKTFDIFESYWPARAEQWPGINDVTKYVVSRTRSSSGWSNAVFLDGVEAIKELRASEGADIKLWGSSELMQTLLEHDLVDELRLKTYPIILGSGKKLFGSGARAAAFGLVKTFVTPKGIIMANYERNGEVQTGTVAD